MWLSHVVSGAEDVAFSADVSSPTKVLRSYRTTSSPRISSGSCSSFVKDTTEVSEFSHKVCVRLLREEISSMSKFLVDFQNFLRTQTGNTTTVNIIISTVDYLLRLQVSTRRAWLVGSLPSPGSRSRPCSGVHQRLLLVLLRQRGDRRHREDQLLQSSVRRQADIQLADRVHSGRVPVD